MTERALDVSRIDETPARIDEIVREVVAPASDDVDREARFPSEALEALRAARLLSAGVPVELGGGGHGLGALAEATARLARGCGSTAMVWAMHEVQVACMAASVEADEGAVADFLTRLANEQALVASVTSEVGIGGNLRNSVAAVEEAGDGMLSLEKAAPTISYGEHADAYLVTARRAPESAPDDQVAVILPRDEVQLEPAGTWDALGMRGTVSPGFRLRAVFPPERVLPVPFGSLATRVMVPWSHILWGSCWHGLAREAFSRARKMARKRAAGKPDRSDVRLAEAARILSLLNASLSDAIDHLVPVDAIAPLTTARLNDLKLSVSRLAIEVAEISLAICGMPGYQERNPVSVARILRDLHSAPLMIGNDRILATNAELALVRES
jgi:acyl-CoA dehydrogenase